MGTIAKRRSIKGNGEPRVKLCNSRQDLITHGATQQFIEDVHRERIKGYGFVPFVGAGFSAPSGIPLVSEIKPYLDRCICMALGVENPALAWNPRTDQWPPFVDSKSYKDRLRALIEERKQRLWDPELAVLQEGEGAMAEWRTALLFLSRIVRERRTEDHRDVVSLDAPQQEIIDACLREVMKGRFPALEHRMLGVLAGVLRLDLLLTTNFDDLLERAFAAARNPLEVLEVPLGSTLPHWSAVSNVRSLIKLHGNRHALRADYSLDAMPSENDKQRFLEYLLSPEGRSKIVNDSGKEDLTFQNHLLVIGYSANDRRIRALIEYAWQRLRGDFKVYWLCYSINDVERIKAFSNEACRSREGSVILRHASFGLVLLQMYQNIRRNLPPLGGLFPSVSRLTVPPLALDVRKEAVKKKGTVKNLAKERFSEGVHKVLRSFQENPRRFKLLVATSAPNVHGVTSTCAQIFRDLEVTCKCLWLDMNDITGADNLFEVLLEAAYFRLGLEHWTPTFVDADAGRRAREFRRVTDTVNARWIIFLNARETPGANTLANDAVVDSNGWLDKPRRDDVEPGDEDTSSCVEAFGDLLAELCGPDSERISVVLLCRTADNGKDNVIDGLKKRGLIHGGASFRNPSSNNGGVSSHDVLELMSDSADGGKFDETEICKKVIRWIAQRPAELVDSTKQRHLKEQKRRFLHALVLMQRPRFWATIWSTAVTVDCIEAFAEKRHEWVDELELTGLVRRKAGGFIWIHSRCRQAIRRILYDVNSREMMFADDKEVLKEFSDWEPRESVSEIHAKLSEWYEKVLDASEAPVAVFEVAYHLCMSAHSRLDLEKSSALSRGESITWATEKLDAAAAVLKAHSFLVQTRGYSRGSCRRLLHIRDTLCREVSSKARDKNNRVPKKLQGAITRLCMVCSDLMRAIAREVGEDGKAYLRHRQYAVNLAGKEWGKEWEDRKDGGFGKLVLDSLNRAGADPSKVRTEWIRWWRWNGMLGIASRSFDAAESSLNRAYFYSMTPLPKMVKKPSNAKHDATGGPYSLEVSRTQGERLEVLRVIEQQVALSLLKQSVKLRIQGLRVPRADNKETEDNKRDIEKVENLVQFGLDLVRSILGNDHSSDSHYMVRALWCKSRLLMHQSVCAARRVQLDSEGKVALLQHAMSLLGDAEASLRIGDSRRHRPDMAMIELHRAEARLREADACIVEGVDKVCFAGVCRRLEEIDNTSVRKGRTFKIEEFCVNGSLDGLSQAQGQLRRVRSLVLDGLRFLGRAEPVLRERRRNVWWTTWFFERRLRAISMSVWASILEVDTPIPFLGLESVVQGAPTTADVLLDDAIRMIRVDAYRLATIVDSYGSCARAFQLRLILEGSETVAVGRQERMQEERIRQRSMGQKLQDAVGVLEGVYSRRKEIPPGVKQGDYNHELDAAVKKYVEIVLTRSERIVQKLLM